MVVSAMATTAAPIGRDFSKDFVVDDEDVPKARSTSGNTVDGSEIDAHQLAQRQKQLEYGKNTLGYQNYLAQVPKDKRRRRGKMWIDPCTPDPTQRISKRCFDGQVRAWRRALHKFDDTSAAGEENIDDKTTADNNKSKKRFHNEAFDGKGNDTKSKPAFGERHASKHTTASRQQQQSERPAHSQPKRESKLGSKATAEGEQGDDVYALCMGACAAGVAEEWGSEVDGDDVGDIKL